MDETSSDVESVRDPVTSIDWEELCADGYSNQRNLAMQRLKLAQGGSMTLEQLWRLSNNLVIGSNAKKVDICAKGKGIGDRHATVSLDNENRIFIHGDSQTYLVMSAQLGGRDSLPLEEGDEFLVGSVRIRIIQIVKKKIDISASESNVTKEGSIVHQSLGELMGSVKNGRGLEAPKTDRNSLASEMFWRKEIKSHRKLEFADRLVQYEEPEPIKEYRSFSHIQERIKQVKLQIVNGVDEGDTHIIDGFSKDPTIFGTDMAASIILEGPDVCPVHSKLDIKGDELLLSDLSIGHTIGTRYELTDQRPISLQIGDLVELGSGNHFVIRPADASGMGDTCEGFVLALKKTRRSKRKSRTSKFAEGYVLLPDRDVCVGRSDNCDVQVNDMSLAKMHVQLMYRDNRFHIAPLIESRKKGAFILLGRHGDGDFGSYRLHLGDSFRVGNTTMEVLEIRTESMEDLRTMRALHQKRVCSLREVPLFCLLPEEDLYRIANALSSITFNDGDVIIQEGDTGEEVYFIEDGKVQVSIKDGDDEKVVIGNMHAGDYFGEIGLIQDRPRSATITAQGRVKCLYLYRQAFLHMFGPLMFSLMMVEMRNRERMKRVGILKQVPFLSSLGDEALEGLSDHVQLESFPDKALLMEEGKPGDRMFIVIIGRVTVFNTDKKTNQVKILANLSQGSYVGEMAIILDRPRSASVAADGPVAVMSLQKDLLTETLSPEIISKLQNHSDYYDLQTQLNELKDDEMLQSSCYSTGAPQSSYIHNNRTTSRMQGSSVIYPATTTPTNQNPTSLRLDANGSNPISSHHQPPSPSTHSGSKWRRGSRGREGTLATQYAAARTKALKRKSDTPFIGERSSTASIEAVTGLASKAVMNMDDDEEEMISGGRASRVLSTVGIEVENSLPFPTIRDYTEDSSSDDDSISRIKRPRRHSTNTSDVSGQLLGSKFAKRMPRPKRNSQGAELRRIQRCASVRKQVQRRGSARRLSAGKQLAAGILDNASQKVTDMLHSSLLQKLQTDDAHHLPVELGESGMNNKISTIQDEIDALTLRELDKKSHFILLRATCGPHRGQMFAVCSDIATIGNRGSSVQLNDVELSQHNSQIEYRDGSYWLSDLDSKSGTFLKLKINKEYTLDVGTIISIGNIECRCLAKMKSQSQSPAEFPIAVHKHKCCTIQ